MAATTETTHLPRPGQTIKVVGHDGPGSFVVSTRYVVDVDHVARKILLASVDEDGNPRLDHEHFGYRKPWWSDADRVIIWEEGWQAKIA